MRGSNRICFAKRLESAIVFRIIGNGSSGVDSCAAGRKLSGWLTNNANKTTVALFMIINLPTNLTVRNVYTVRPIDVTFAHIVLDLMDYRPIKR